MGDCFLIGENACIFGKRKPQKLQKLVKCQDVQIFRDVVAPMKVEKVRGVFFNVQAI